MAIKGNIEINPAISKKALHIPKIRMNNALLFSKGERMFINCLIIFNFLGYFFIFMIFNLNTKLNRVYIIYLNLNL